MYSAKLITGFAAVLLVLASPARAIDLSSVGVTNRSSPNDLIDEALRVREFRTASTLVFLPTTDDSVGLSHRLAWMSAQRVEPGLPFAVLSWGKRVDYTLSFTVEDPTSRGYTLDVDSVFRGYVTAQWDGNSGTGPSSVFAAGTLMAASLDSGTGPIALPTLNTAIKVATATATEPFENLLVEDTGSFTSETFVGTKFFQLSFTTLAANTNAALQNLNNGEVNVRFGLDPTSARFGNAAYPGPDGELASAHGHFLTVTANFAPVPEPSTWAALTAGLLALAMATRGGRLRRQLPGAKTLDRT